MTAFLANMVRNEDKVPEPYTTKDFLVDWSEVWDAVAKPPIDGLTEEEELKRSEALLGKVISLNTYFGGLSKQ